jgi:hypothetical protein
MSIATVTLTAAPASATSGSIERSCGTYYIGVTRAVANTTKGAQNTCAGHAYVSIKDNHGKWYDWKSGKDSVKINNGNIVASMHKGCATCEVYTLYV